MHNSKIKRVSLAVCLALMPFVAEAAGLGRLTVLSGLGEPFSAEIELSAGKDELSSLSARIAPTEIYAEHGVERTSSLGAIRVELGSKSDGSPVLRLSSPQPVNDPFLDMLIQVDWPTGRLLREYTALLDPPGYAGITAASDMPALAETATPARDLSKKNTDKRAPSLGRPSAVVVADTDKSEATKSYRTKSGDTLRGVARKMQVEDVSLEQMLVGLYRANRDAFLAQNMNQLKVGKIIRAPQEDALRSISQQEAVEEVRLHASNWNAYRSNLADVAAHTAPPATTAAQQQTSAGRITATTEDKAAPPPQAGPRDVVKLSKSEVAGVKTGTAEAKGSVADDKLKALEEESTAQENAIKDVTERITIFEKQIQDMQKLLVVQNQMLAELQKGTAAKPATAVSPAPAAAVVPVAQEPQATPPAPETPKPVVKQVPPPPPEPSELSAIIGAVTDNPLLLAGGGVLMLLGGAWMFVRNRRRKGLDSFEQGILASGGRADVTVFGKTAGGDVDTGKTSFMADFAQHAGGDMIDTSDVDPISEADVYMAYGRDVQAEEILKDAIAKEPGRYELHQKLLGIYAGRKNTVAFETLAGELYAALGASSPIWLSVAELGRALEPQNPMYAAAAGVAGAEAEMPPVDAGTKPGEPAAAAVDDKTAESVAGDNSLDFDLGTPATDVPVEESAAEAAAEGSGAGESLPVLDMGEESVAELKLTGETPDEDAGLDFELPEPAAAGNVQLDAADLGMRETEAEPLPELPEVEGAEEEAVVELHLPDEESSVTAAEAAADEEVAELALPVAEVPESPDQAVNEPAMPETRSGQEVSESLEDISFDLPELELPADEEPIPAVEAPVSAGTDDLEAEINALDVAFDLPVEAALSTQESPAETEPGAGEFPALGPAQKFDSEDAAANVEEIVFETPATAEGGLDFDFDLDMGAEAPPEEPRQEVAKALPDLDLAGISLDMGKSTQADSAVTEEITLFGPESSDVDTKLDLVTAYMDMGDAEGARELLEEVLQEGGPQQRARAQKLLETLG